MSLTTARFAHDAAICLTDWLREHPAVISATTYHRGMNPRASRIIDNDTSSLDTEKQAAVLSESMALHPALMHRPRIIDLRLHGDSFTDALMHVQLVCDYDPETLTGYLSATVGQVYTARMHAASLEAVGDAHPQISVTLTGREIADNGVRHGLEAVMTYIETVMVDGCAEIAGVAELDARLLVAPMAPHTPVTTAPAQNSTGRRNNTGPKDNTVRQNNTAPSLLDRLTDWFRG